MDINSTNLLTIYKNPYAPSNQAPLKKYYYSRKEEAELEAKKRQLPESSVVPIISPKQVLAASAALSLTGLGIFLSRNQIMYNPSKFFRGTRTFLAKYLKLNTFRVLNIQDDFRLGKKPDTMRIYKIFDEGTERHILNVMKIVSDGLSKKASPITEGEKDTLIFIADKLIKERMTASSINPEEAMLSGIKIIPDILNTLKIRRELELHDFVERIIPLLTDKAEKASDRFLCLDKLLKGQLLNEKNTDFLLSLKYEDGEALKGLISVLRIAKIQTRYRDNFPKKLFEDFFTAFAKSDQQEKHILTDYFLNNVRVNSPDRQKEFCERFLSEIATPSKGNAFDDERFVNTPFELLARYINFEDADITKFGFKNITDFYKAMDKRFNYLSDEIKKKTLLSQKGANIHMNLISHAIHNLNNRKNLKQSEEMFTRSVEKLLQNEDKMVTQFIKNAIRATIELLSESNYHNFLFLDKIHKLYPFKNMPEKIGLKSSQVFSYETLKQQQRILNIKNHPDNFPGSKLKRKQGLEQFQETNCITEELASLCKRPAYMNRPLKLPPGNENILA